MIELYNRFDRVGHGHSLRIPVQLRRSKLAADAAWAMEFDPVTVDLWEAEQRAEEMIERMKRGHPFVRPALRAELLNYHLKVDPDVRGCAGALLVPGNTILYAPNADPRVEGSAITHEICEGQAGPSASHGDIWRVNLAAIATRAELRDVSRMHGLTLRVLAHYQPHIALDLLRLRLWMINKFNLLQPKLPRFPRST